MNLISASCDPNGENVFELGTVVWDRGRISVGTGVVAEKLTRNIGPIASVASSMLFRYHIA